MISKSTLYKCSKQAKAKKNTLFYIYSECVNLNCGRRKKNNVREGEEGYHSGTPEGVRRWIEGLSLSKPPEWP